VLAQSYSRSDPHTTKRRDTRARATEKKAPDTMNQADVDKQINQVRDDDNDDDDNDDDDATCVSSSTR